MTPLLHVEHGADGLRVFSIDPGFTLTERMLATAAGDQYTKHFTPATPDVIGRAIRWLCTDAGDPEGADALRGQVVLAQREVKRRALLPGWPAPAGRGDDSVAEPEHRPARGDHGQGDDGVAVGAGLQGEEVAHERDHEGEREGADQAGEQREAQWVERSRDILQQHQEGDPAGGDDR